MVMRVIGVIDLKDGVAVHAVRGERQSYRPVRSKLVEGAEPVAVARALHALGLRELYVADLDAILGRSPQETAVAELCAVGVPLWPSAAVTKLDAICWPSRARPAVCEPSFPIEALPVL